jgi:localization factor PodJL
VLQDLAEARQWLEKAARAGNADAEMELADIYARGLGVSEDKIEAYAWNAIAAAHGNKLAATQRDNILGTLSPSDQSKAETRANALETSMEATPAPSPSAPSPTQHQGT